MTPRPTDTATTSAGTAGAMIFRREGEYWTVVYHDEIVRLRDSKGLRYIAHLLRYPGARFAARDLWIEAPVKTRSRRVETQEGSTGGVIPDTRHPTPSEDERARLSVTKRIKAAVKNIETHHPALAYHLGTTVKTGAFCVYLPDPERPIIWTT